VYLHCVLGFNRSAAVAVLVVERFFNVTRQEAVEYVHARRHVDPSKHLAMFDRSSTSL
jgi:protein-tyrosine phosphatase